MCKKWRNYVDVNQYTGMTRKCDVQIVIFGNFPSIFMSKMMKNDEKWQN
jgi:hypothetical protein